MKDIDSGRGAPSCHYKHKWPPALHFRTLSLGLPYKAYRPHYTRYSVAIFATRIPGKKTLPSVPVNFWGRYGPRRPSVCLCLCVAVSAESFKGATRPPSPLFLPYYIRVARLKTFLLTFEADEMTKKHQP